MGEGCSMSECALQETCEGGDRHLAGPHGKFAMADTAEPRRMPVDRNIVGRIGEDEVSPFGSHQTIEDIVVSGIAADQAMAVETPHPALPRSGSQGWRPNDDYSAWMRLGSNGVTG
jgi:hypothetical protein